MNKHKIKMVWSRVAVQVSEKQKLTGREEGKGKANKSYLLDTLLREGRRGSLTGLGGGS